jgi:hypothetical protein
MSTSTSVHVGVYLECMQVLVDRLNEDPDPSCSKDPRHNHTIHHNHKHCPACGAKVDRAPKVEKTFFSFWDLVNGAKRLGGTKKDQDVVLDEFSFVSNESVGDETAGKDILLYVSGNEEIDADSEGMHVVPQLEHGFERPSQELIDQLQKVCGYTHVRVKYGVLVDVA